MLKLTSRPYLLEGCCLRGAVTRPSQLYRGRTTGRFDNCKGDVHPETTLESGLVIQSVFSQSDEVSLAEGSCKNRTKFCNRHQIDDFSKDKRFKTTANFQQISRKLGTWSTEAGENSAIRHVIESFAPYKRKSYA